MYRAGLVLGTAMFFTGVIEWILRTIHYIDLIEKTLPWTVHFTSPTGIWVTVVIGLLILSSAWIERRKEVREEGESQKLPGTAKVTATASPHIEVKPEIKGIENKVEQHFNLTLPENLMQDFAKVIVKALKEGEVQQSEQTLPGPGQGFVQFESRSICVESKEDAPRVLSGDLRVGEVLRIEFHYANRGQTPVKDCQAWGLIAVVDPAKNPGSKLREVMLEGIKVGYERFKGSGNDLGVDKSAFNFAVGTPLSAQDIAGLKDGSLRVHLMLGGAWRNGSGRAEYWSYAEWTNWPQVPIERSFWKGA